MANPKGEFSGKVVIVTGAGGVNGLGEVTARLFAENGAKIVLADLQGSQLEATTASIAKDGYEVVSQFADISSEDSVKSLIAFTQKTFGRLDVLDNNAASQGHPEDGTVGEMPVDLWDKVMSVNARGTMLMCKHAVPLMIAGGGGSIVNISSGTSQAGDFYATAYACTKGAINTLTKYVATQYGPQGVRCNAVAPGLIMTPKLAEAMPLPFQDLFRSHSVTKKLGQPLEIANMVAFLASERANFISGQVFNVDGGIYAHIPSSYQMADMIAQMKGK
jgi:NAD(P)-dependent dehydrogenase (short-subunit alcohol dehydrogenase family)